MCVKQKEMYSFQWLFWREEGRKTAEREREKGEEEEVINMVNIIGNDSPTLNFKKVY